MERRLSLLVAEGDRVAARRGGSSYDEDVEPWAMRQAELLRLSQFHDLDADNLADEVEDVARREPKALVSRLSLVSSHLLKWDYQREHGSAGWARTIREQRRQADELLDEMPSLRSRLALMSEEAFRQGRAAALNETGLEDAEIPEVNPFTWEDFTARPVP